MCQENVSIFYNRTWGIKAPVSVWGNEDEECGRILLITHLVRGVRCDDLCSLFVSHRTSYWKAGTRTVLSHWSAACIEHVLLRLQIIIKTENFLLT